jgi:hypothetical protein
MNLTEMRARVRQDLQDTDSENYRWSNDEVDAAIQRVVREYSLRAPIQMLTDVTTTPADNELDISGLTDLIGIESVEFPIGHWQTCQYWAGRVFMQDNGNGDFARVRWFKKHTLTAQSSTIPAEHEEIIVLGATGYLAMSASAATVDRAFIAGRYGTISYRDWGRERLDRYDKKLKEAARSNRVVARTLYPEDD